MNTSKKLGAGTRWGAGLLRWGMALPLLLTFAFWSNAQPPDRKGAPPPPPDKAAEGQTKTIRGLVKEFTTAPKGETDCFILDDGTEVHFPPPLSDKVMAVVNKKDRLKVTGRSMKMPGGETHFQASNITNLRTNASIDITDDAPPPPPDGGKAPPAPPPGEGRKTPPPPPPGEGRKAPPPPPADDGVAPPPPDRRGGPDRAGSVEQRLQRLEDKMDRLLDELKRLKRDKD